MSSFFTPKSLLKMLAAKIIKFFTHFNAPKNTQNKIDIEFNSHDYIPIEIADYHLPDPEKLANLDVLPPAPPEIEDESYLAPKVPENRVPEVPVSSAINEFSLVQLSPHSRRAYAKDLKDFFSYIRTRDVWDDWNQSLSPLLVAEYREHLFVERKLSKATITRKLAVLKSFCKWALSRGWIERNPADLVRSFPQTQESKTGFLSDQEIKTLLRSLPTDLETPRLFRALTRVTIETLIMLGLRRSEAASIHLNDIEYTDQTWLLRVHGKGSRERLLPLPPRLLATWSEWLGRIVPTAPFSNMEDAPNEWTKFIKAHKDQPILVSTRSKEFHTPISPGEIGHIVRKAGHFAQLNKRLSPHMLRATAITHALDQGASHRGIQQMAGWTSPLMITRYDKRKNDPKFSAVHQLLYSKDWDFLDEEAPHLNVAESNEVH